MRVRRVWKFDPRVGGIQEKMANSTIKLDIVKPIGKWTGTGIFFHFYNSKDPSRQIQVVITARHLIEDALSVAMVWPTEAIDKAMASAREKVAYTKDSIKIEYHPDETVDLCAIIVSHAVCELRNKGKEPTFFSFDTSVLAGDDFYAKERQLDDIPNNGGSSGSPVFHFDKKPALALQLPGGGFVLVFVLQYPPLAEGKIKPILLA